MALTLSGAVKNAQANVIGDQADGGKLRIYDGTRPLTPDTALSGNNLLAELTLNAAAFPPASGGLITAAAITRANSAALSGTATWFRQMRSDGTTPLVDGDASDTGGTGDLKLVSTNIIAGEPVEVSSFTIQMGG